MDTSVHLTIAQAADHAHVSTKTIRRMVKRGQLSVAGRMGPAYVIAVADLDRAVANGHASTRPAQGTHPRSMDTSTVHPDGHHQDGQVSITQLEAAAAAPWVEALERANAQLVVQAEELGHVRAELANAQEQLRALQAPQEQPQPAQAAQEGTPSHLAAQTAFCIVWISTG